MGCGGIGISASDASTTTIVSVAFTIIIRIICGPVADGLGVRLTYTCMLIVLCIPGFLAVFVQDFGQLLVVRALIGLIGGSFVLTQLWTTLMFHSNIVGLANATTAGWGNLGGGAALVVIALCFGGFKSSGYDNNTAWRASLAWPPCVVFLTGFAIYFLSDDCPYGNYTELKKRKAEQATDEPDDGGGDPTAEPASIAGRSLKIAASNWRVWILFVVYMFCFGLELVVNGQISLYLSQAFAMSQQEGALVGGCFGLTNLFARSFGGWMSDYAYKRWSVRGRIWSLFLQTIMEGILMLIFTHGTYETYGPGGALAVLIFWGITVQATEGGTYGLVPFVEPSAVGGVAGIVGAGGNTGALIGNTMVKYMKVRPAFAGLGWLTICAGFLVTLIHMPGHGSMFCAPEPPKEEEQMKPAAGKPAGGEPAQYLPYAQPMMTSQQMFTVNQAAPQQGSAQAQQAMMMVNGQPMMPMQPQAMPHPGAAPMYGYGMPVGAPMVMQQPGM
mmetsp:Transcript_5953/g.14157  ORF Transcript_5953/g.14157 Transcript_5953/m.14157 type:complete len:500 (-) Transcript_5953:233-1732(-)